MKRMICFLLLATLGLAGINSAFAQGYLGAAVGSTSPDEEGFDSDNGFKFTGGYRINKNIALEASYVDLGEFEADDDLVAAAEYLSGTSLNGVSVEITGIELSVIGFAPVSDVVALFARVGVFNWDADLVVETTFYGSGSVSEDGSDPFLGAGIQLDVSERVAIKAEFVRYDAYEGDVDFMGAGLHIKF